MTKHQPGTVNVGTMPLFINVDSSFHIQPDLVLPSYSYSSSFHLLLPVGQFIKVFNNLLINLSPVLSVNINICDLLN
jgi:hypothetical protein